jgi:hypothetical protein
MNDTQLAAHTVWDTLDDDVTCGACDQKSARWFTRCGGCAGVDLNCQPCRNYFDDQAKGRTESACLTCGHITPTPIAWHKL